MPAPSVATYSLAVRVAANASVLAAIDAAATAGKIKCYDAADVLLATITLNDPAGTLNAGNAILTITPPAAAPISVGGICAYGTITDGDDSVVVSIPAEQGESAVIGKLVLGTLTFVAGANIEVTSCVIG